MKTLRKHKIKICMIAIILLIQIVLPLLTSMVENSYASEIKEYAKTKELVEAEYSDDFKAWLELSDEEKEEILMPKMYAIEDDIKTDEQNIKINPSVLKQSSEEDEEELPSRFTLKDIIPQNVIVKDQVGYICWAYTGSAMLETALALNDYYNGLSEIAYDVSERHMDYATSTKNKTTGFYRSAGSGGSFYLAAAYLTNGLGAVSEEDVPISSSPSTIEGYDRISQVYDIIDYPYREASAITDDDIEEMKRHIMNYGGIYGSVYVKSGTTYNSAGAIYSTSTSGNHAVTIVGWDDDYSRTNFLSSNRPSKNGAWIVKNSWGEDYGDEGFYYVSYQDNVIYRLRYGIEKVSNTVNYDNIYQYNPYGASKLFYYTKETEEEKVYLANIFERESEKTEYLTEVSVYAGETYNCKVYVNPNGTSKSKEDLIEAKLKYGDSENTETFKAGYRTLELEEPIELTGENFVVVLEIQVEGLYTYIYGESKSGSISGYDYEDFSYVTTNAGKCFYGGEAAFNGDEDEWLKFSSKSADSTIKAFTVNEIKDNPLKEIVVTTVPEKDEYIEGESFDETGMVVTAIFNNGTTRELISGENAKYTIENGEILSLETSAKIIYTYEGEEFTAEIPITVERNCAVSLEITKAPNKVEYYEGQNFDTEGMEITATFLDETTKVIEDYEIINGENLKNGQNTVTISYDGQTVEQGITVIKKVIEKIEITKVPNKTTYIEGENFEAEGMEITATYNDGETKVITDYKVTDGENLTVEKTSIKVSYTEDEITKTVEQEITVIKKVIEKIEITKAPNKTTYIEGENFEAEGMEITATYNDGKTKVITDYKITDGENLAVEKTNIKVSYTEDEITKTVEQEIKVLEKLKINIEEYKENEQENKTYIKNIKINETIENLKEKITTNGEIKIYKGETEITNIKEKLATGMRIEIRLREESKEYIVVVAGDANGDGKVNLHDILAINKHRLGKTILTEANLLAGDVDGNGKADLNDILKINKYRLGKISSL